MARFEISPAPLPPGAVSSKTDGDLLQEFLEANQPSFSASYDKDGKLQFLEITGMDDPTFAALIATLQKQFPGAF